MNLAMMQADEEEKRQAVSSLGKRMASQRETNRRLLEENKRLHAAVDSRLTRTVVEQTQTVTSSLTGQVLDHSEKLVEAQQVCAHLRADLERRSEEHQSELAKFAAQKEKRAEELKARIKALEESLEILNNRPPDESATDEQVRAAQRELKQQEAMHATYVSLVDGPPEMVIVKEPVFLITSSSSSSATSSSTTATASSAMLPSLHSTAAPPPVRPQSPTSPTSTAPPVPRRPVPSAPPPTVPPKYVRPSKPPPPPPPHGGVVKK